MPSTPLRTSSKISRRRRPVFPNEGKLRYLFDQCFSNSDVRGCFIGRKRVDGRKTSQLSVVCCVREKRPRSRLDSRQKIPKELQWTDGRNFHGRIPTDVQVLAKCDRFAAVPGPGDRLSVGEPPAAATVGVALSHPTFGRVLTTAGHAFLAGPGTSSFAGGGSVLRLRNASGGPAVPVLPRRAVWTASADYALVAVTDSDPTNLFDDELLVTGPHWAMASDIGKQLLALTSRGLIPMVFEGVKAAIEVGGHMTESMLLAKPLSKRNAPRSGDSGCCLVDDQFRLWGLLVGICMIEGKQVSVFHSPHWLFADGAQLL